jgi:hypothetical protein
MFEHYLIQPASISPATKVRIAPCQDGYNIIYLYVQILTVIFFAML